MKPQIDISLCEVLNRSHEITKKAHKSLAHHERVKNFSFLGNSNKNYISNCKFNNGKSNNLQQNGNTKEKSQNKNTLKHYFKCKKSCLKRKESLKCLERKSNKFQSLISYLNEGDNTNNTDASQNTEIKSLKEVFTKYGINYSDDDLSENSKTESENLFDIKDYKENNDEKDKLLPDIAEETCIFLKELEDHNIEFDILSVSSSKESKTLFNNPGQFNENVRKDEFRSNNKSTSNILTPYDNKLCNSIQNHTNSENIKLDCQKLLDEDSDLFENNQFLDLLCLMHTKEDSTGLCKEDNQWLNETNQLTCVKEFPRITSQSSLDVIQNNQFINGQETSINTDYTYLRTNLDSKDKFKFKWVLEAVNDTDKKIDKKQKTSKISINKELNQSVIDSKSQHNSKERPCGSCHRDVKSSLDFLFGESINGCQEGKQFTNIKITPSETQPSNTTVVENNFESGTDEFTINNENSTSEVLTNNCISESYKSVNKFTSHSESKGGGISELQTNNNSVSFNYDVRILNNHSEVFQLRDESINNQNHLIFPQTQNILSEIPEHSKNLDENACILENVLDNRNLLTPSYNTLNSTLAIRTADTNEYFNKSQVRTEQTGCETKSINDHILKKNFMENLSRIDKENCIEGTETYSQTEKKYLKEFLEEKLHVIREHLFKIQNNLSKVENKIDVNQIILNGLTDSAEQDALKIIESQEELFSQSLTFTPVILSRASIKCSQTNCNTESGLPENQVLKDKIVALSKEDSLICKSAYDLRIPDDIKRMFILQKISDVFTKILDDVNYGRVSVLQIRSPSKWQNCIFNNKMLILKPIGETINVKISQKRNKSRFNLIIFVIGKIVELLINNSFCTKRELYYQLVKYVKNQTQINLAVDSISRLLDEPPWDFGILATNKGLVYGDLVIALDENDIINCNIPGGTLIPQVQNKITKLVSNACFILVVEKDSIFQKLLDEDLPNKLPKPFIMLTGKGFSDINTRLFINKLWQILCIPVFVLVDADPYGIEIMLTYRFGSLAHSHLSEYLALPNLRWIGVHPKEIISLNISRQLLSGRDRKKIHELLKRPYIDFVPKIKEELELMLEKGFKAEIEGLMKSKNYLRDFYIPSKLCAEDFF